MLNAGKNIEFYGFKQVRQNNAPERQTAMTTTPMNQMHQILEKQGVQKAGVFAHRLPEPDRTNCLKQLLLDVKMNYSVIEEQWVQGVLSGRIK